MPMNVEVKSLSTEGRFFVVWRRCKLIERKNELTPLGKAVK
jgi:hypothetical protein